MSNGIGNKLAFYSKRGNLSKSRNSISSSPNHVRIAKRTSKTTKLTSKLSNPKSMTIEQLLKNSSKNRKPNPKVIHNLYKSLKPETFRKEKYNFGNNLTSSKRRGSRNSNLAKSDNGELPFKKTAPYHLQPDKLLTGVYSSNIIDRIEFDSNENSGLIKGNINLKYDSSSQLSGEKGLSHAMDELRSIGGTPKSVIKHGSHKIVNKELSMVLLEMRNCLNTKNRKIDDLEQKNAILTERVRDKY